MTGTVRTRGVKDRIPRIWPGLGIQYRVLLTTTGVLIVCLGLTGYVLDRSFRASIVAGAEAQLQLVIYSLMGAAADAPGGPVFGPELPEPRLAQPESGLYAMVTDATGGATWRSPSYATSPIDVDLDPAPMYSGQWRFEMLDDHFALSYAVIWEAAEESQFVFTVITDQAPFAAVIRGFRRNLWFGVVVVMVLFVGAQLLAVRWGLRPLRTMAEEVRELEAGDRQRLGATYPRELRGLAANLDRFIDHEQRNRARYRNAMADLAHSLKTPLTVLRNGLADRSNGFDARLLLEQLDRMETTVSHQLSRASMTGPIVVGAQVQIDALVSRLTRALTTAYRDRGLTVAVDIEPDLSLRIDERDLMEMLGNLMENAFKYTRTRVLVTGRHAGDWVVVDIDDDGPGIAPAQRDRVLHRGIRADTQQQGQGIGLSVVYELVTLYQGELTLDDGPLGGARVSVRLPA